MLILERPGCLQTQAEGQNLGAVHAIPPVVVEALSWLNTEAGIHTQRRRAEKSRLRVSFLASSTCIERSPDAIEFAISAAYAGSPPRDFMILRVIKNDMAMPSSNPN